MKPEEILAGLEAVLTAPLTAMTVALSIHGAEDDAYQRLQVTPEQLRVCLFLGAVTISPDEMEQDAGVATVALRAVVQTPQELSAVHNAEVWKERAGSNVSLLTVTGWVRTLIQRVLFTARGDFDNQHGFRFLRMAPYQPNGERGLRSMELTFSCIISLDLPADHPLEVPA